MLREVKKFCSKYAIDFNSKVGVAVSGGLDSMLLLQLVTELFNSVHVLHVNYNLRGEDSKLDEQLVQNYCVTNKLTFHLKSIKLKDKSKSIQEEARNIRYEWFNEIADIQEINHVFIAHHLDDQLETFLMNLERGSGLSGLSGIPEKNEIYYRPLLSFSREELSKEANIREISYREDASNRSDKYTRNSLRIKVIPELKRILPSILNGVNSSIEILRDTNDLVSDQSLKLQNQLLKEKKINSLLLLREPKAIVKHLFNSIGFSSLETDKILASIKSNNVGAIHTSSQVTILIDREDVILKERELPQFSIEIEEVIGEVDTERLIIVESLLEDVDYSLEGEYLASEKLHFPIVARTWEEGDTFRPLGMKGLKKVSDFLIDLKVNRFDKKKVIVVESNGEIAAVLPYRIDDRFKIDKESKSAYLVKLKHN